MDRNRSESVPSPVRIGRRKASVRCSREVVHESPTSLAKLPYLVVPPDGNSIHSRQCCVGIAD